MKVLCYKDLLLGFIFQKMENKEHQKQIKKILENENSVFLHSKKFFQFIKEELGEEYEQEYQAILTKFKDSGSNIPSSETSKTFEEEVLNIHLKAQDRVVVNISYQEPAEEIRKKIPNLAVLSKQQKPNYHWLVVQLAILHPNKLTVHCFDFGTNSSISDFFKDVFSLPKNIREIDIFDAQCNFSHDKFDSIAKKVFVNYRTKFHNPKKDPLKNKENKDQIKLKFGGKSKMWTITSSKAHGRRVIFENIIITCDNDFWNLEINASDWNIDVQYCEQTANKWLTRCEYQEFR